MSSEEKAELMSHDHVGKAERITVIVALVAATFGYATVISDLNERVTIVEQVQDVEIRNLKNYSDRMRDSLSEVRRYFINKIEKHDRMPHYRNGKRYYPTDDMILE